MKPHKPRHIDKLRWSPTSGYSYDIEYYHWADEYDCGKGGKFLKNKRLMCPNCKFVFKRHYFILRHNELGNGNIKCTHATCPHCRIAAVGLDPRYKVPKLIKR